MNAQFESQHCIPSSHPSLAGHFPGNPVVPAVVVLNTVDRAVMHWLPGYRIAVVVQAKFLHLLKPEQPFTVRLTRAKPKEVRFECRVLDVRFAAGLMQIEKTA